MRDFETDFEFDWEETIKAADTRGLRIDTYPTITMGKNTVEALRGPERKAREARVTAHAERVQREMAELGLKKGDRE